MPWPIRPPAPLGAPPPRPTPPDYAEGGHGCLVEIAVGVVVVALIALGVWWVKGWLP